MRWCQREDQHRPRLDRPRSSPGQNGRRRPRPLLHDDLPVRPHQPDRHAPGQRNGTLRRVWREDQPWAVCVRAGAPAGRLWGPTVKVLVWARGVDTGGQGWRIGQGFAKHAPDWQVDVPPGSANPLGYPERPMTPRERFGLVPRLYAQADVVHLRTNLDGWRKEDNGACKPIVLHHHGSLFREAHGSIAKGARAIGAVQIVSTLDLTLHEPDVEWLPSPYPMAELAALRDPRDGPVRIAHFPTSAKVKSTHAFLAATQRLAERYPIEVLTNVVRGHVRHIPVDEGGWAEVMARKATADIYFDQVQLGYGNNAVEAWGMGIPVVAGVVDPAVRALMVERFGRLPFVEATEDTIEVTLERLIQSRAMRDEYGNQGRDHALRFHDDAKVVAQLQGIYASAKPTIHQVLPRPSPAWLLHRQARKAA